jgi:hypothetical protein
MAIVALISGSGRVPEGGVVDEGASYGAELALEQLEVDGAKLEDLGECVRVLGQND